MELTRRDKIDAIEAFCMEHDCNNCPLIEVGGSCYGDDADIDRNYDVIMGNEVNDVKGEEDKVVELQSRPFLHKPEVNTEQEHDPVNHPSHYTHGGMEAINEMILLFGTEAVKHFCLCNAWKYRKRAMYKNGQEDMDKSDWYIKKYEELTMFNGSDLLEGFD